MKKIFALLLLPWLAFGLDTTGIKNEVGTDANATANWGWTPAAPGSLTPNCILICKDSSGITEANTIFSASAGIKSLFSTSGYAGTMSWSGYTLTASDTVSLDDDGTINAGNGVTFGKLFHIGSGAGVITGLNTVLTGTGIMDIDRSNRFNSLVVSGALTSSGAATLGLRNNTVITIPAAASLTITNSLDAQISTSGQSIKQTAGTTFNGAGSQTYRIYADNVIDTIPAIAYTGSGTWGLANEGNVTGTHILTGALNLGTARLDISNSGTLAIYFDANGQNITCGAFVPGASGSGTASIRLGSGIHGFSGNYVGTIYNTGLCSLYCQTSTVNFGGNVTIGTQTVLTQGTALFNAIAGGTWTLNSKRIYDLTYNNSSTGTFKNADSLNMTGDFIVTDGRDSLYNPVTCVDITINSTDTSFIAAPINWSGVAVFGATARPFWQVGRNFTANGSGTQTLTSAGQELPILTIKSTGTVRPTDSATIWNILDSTANTWDMDYGFRCTTAVWAAACSVAQSGAMEAVKNLSYGLQVKENITGTTSFVGGVSGTWRDSGVTVADVVENKVGAGIGLTVTSRANVGGDFTVTDGTLWGNGGDTLNIPGDFTCNNSGDSIARTGTGTFVIIVGGNFSTAAGVLWDTANVKILYRKASGTIALNGATVPFIQLDSTAATIEDGGVINRLSFGTDGLKVKYEVAKKFTFTNIDTANWNGTSIALDSMVSSNATDACTLDFPANNIYSYMYFRDCQTISPDTLRCPWLQGCRSGGGN